MTINRDHTCRHFILLAVASIALLSAPTAKASNPPCSTKNVIGPANPIEIANIQPAQGTTIYTTPGTEHTFSLTATDVDEYGDPLLCNEDRLTYRWTDSAGGSQTGTQTTYDFTPPDAGEYSVTCTVMDPTGPGDDILDSSGRNPSVTWNVVAVKVKILLDAEDYTNQVKDTIVGLRNNLAVEVVPSNLVVDSYEWSIPDKHIKAWNWNSTSSSVVPVSTTDLKQPSLYLYWVSGGDGKPVRCNVKIGDISFTGNTTINVKRPSALISTTTSLVSIGTFVPMSGLPYLALGFFKPAPNPLNGITFLLNSFGNPQGFSDGSTSFLQVVNITTREFTDQSGLIWRRSGSRLLDGANPYGLANNITALDSPTIGLDNVVRGFVEESFSMYFMYKPSGTDTISVPLRKVDWNWKGEANKVGQNWVLSSSAFSANPLSSECVDHPTWTENVANIQLVSNLVITTTSVQDSLVGKPYNISLSCVGGKEPIIWSLSSGSLPRGLNVGIMGSIYGTPTYPGDYQFEIRATDSSLPAFSDTQWLSLHVDAPE